MEYLSGITLEDLVQRYGPVPPGRAIHLLKQVCSSLVEAHGLGLIHRDIKGANVILCRRGGGCDVVKVVDFGLVKDLSRITSATLSGANVIAGTPLYLSPEAISSPDSVDARSDLYSVGVLAYYLLSGKRVFDGKNFLEICAHHLHTPAPPLRSVFSGTLPPELEAVVMSCLEKSPSRRPADAGALLAALSGCSAAPAWTEKEAQDWWREFEEEREAPAHSQPTVALEAPLGPTPLAAGKV
jgi:serine/threonine protein kinase